MMGMEGCVRSFVSVVVHVRILLIVPVCLAVFHLPAVVPDRAAILRSHAIFWSRLGFTPDPCILTVDGKVPTYGEDWHGAINRKMYEAGLRVFSGILFSGWVDDGRYDFAETDRALKELFDNLGPDAYYIPRVKLNPPMGWMKAHPEELFVYENGNPDPEDIRGKVGTAAHDVKGYDAGPEMRSKYRGPDNRGGTFSNQSFASERWVADAEKALVALLDHLRASPYAERILGVHYAYGVSGETCLWGRFGKPAKGDYSRVFERGFLKWGAAKYGDEAAALKAWGGNARVPPYAERETREPLLLAFGRFEDTARNRKLVDLDEYMSDLNAGLCIRFGKVVKERWPGLQTGVFYGYFLECHNAAYTGHCALGKVLDAPEVDFFAAPCSYVNRWPGGSGGFLAPAYSVMSAGKLWVDEIDIRPYFMGPDVFNQNNTPARNRMMFYREFAKNLACGSRFWWMDLGGDWYTKRGHPIQLETVREIEAVDERLSKDAANRKSVADVLVLVDEESMKYRTISEMWSELVMVATRQLTLSGTMSEIRMLRELPKLDLSQYKLIVTFDCARMDDVCRGRLLASPAVKFFTFLDGYSHPKSSSFHMAKLLTGAEVRECRGEEGASRIVFEAPFENGFTGAKRLLAPLPRLMIANGEPLAKDDRGRVVFARIDKRRYYAAYPFLTWQNWRRLAEGAGCTVYGTPPCTVYADSRFTAIFPFKDANPEDLIFTERHSSIQRTMKAREESTAQKPGISHFIVHEPTGGRKSPPTTKGE